MDYVRDETGKIAVMRYNTNSAVEEVPSNHHQYAFTPKHAVCIGWVLEEDLPYIFGLKYKVCECSGGLMKAKYTPASQTAVNVWKTGRP